jgi:uncharacterized membrane protein YuzA (DUF378 family)
MPDAFAHLLQEEIQKEHDNRTDRRRPFLNALALVLVIIGGLNWGFVGLLEVDLVVALFGPGTVLTKLVYVLVGLAALYCLTLFPRVYQNRG